MIFLLKGDVLAVLIGGSLAGGVCVLFVCVIIPISPLLLEKYQQHKRRYNSIIDLL